ncbi:hydrogenase nickel incorporation protein HypB [candidate division KSB1 bacterium]
MTKIDIKKKVLSKNDEAALKLKAIFAEKGIKCFNLIGSPGSGKTSVLEAAFEMGKGSLKCAVIEGDVKTDKDMQRIKEKGIPAVQIETDGACHLNAEQIGVMLNKLPTEEINCLIIENVGNLICPTSYDLGEEERMIVISVAEGDDKPLKYPSAFTSATVMIITKIDLAPYVDSDPETLKNNALSVNPRLKVLMTSAKTGEGIDRFVEMIS